jgi:hypothetical protein
LKLDLIISCTHRLLVIALVYVWIVYIDSAAVHCMLCVHPGYDKYGYSKDGYDKYGEFLVLLFSHKCTHVRLSGPILCLPGSCV